MSDGIADIDKVLLQRYEQLPGNDRSHALTGKAASAVLY